MKLKKEEIVNLWNIIEILNKIKSNVKFTYGIVKNKKIIQSEVEAIKETLKSSERFEEYERNRIKLCSQMSEKNEDNKPIIINNEFKIQNIKLFKIMLNKLVEEYQEDIDLESEKNKQIKNFLQEEVEVELYKINLEYFPEVTTEQMKILIILINDN